MTIHILVTGQLASDPTLRQSAKGTAFATGSIRSGSGDEAVFVNVLAFSKAGERLLQLHKGDALSASGRGELRTWTERGGAEKTGLRVIASEIAAARPRPRPREVPQRQRTSRSSYGGAALDDGVDDLYCGPQ